MFAASEGPTDTHHGRVRILAISTLLLFTASPFSTGALGAPERERVGQRSSEDRRFRCGRAAADTIEFLPTER
jgi:hypothetical protein